MGANGLALATSIAGYVGTTIMIVLLRKRFGRIGFRSVLSELVKILAAAAVCGAVCFGMNALIPEAMGTLPVIGRLIACTAVSGAVYLACCIALRVKPLRELKSALRRG